MYINSPRLFVPASPTGSVAIPKHTLLHACSSNHMAAEAVARVLPQQLAGHTFTISSRFTPKRILGTGSYGVVCSALDSETGQLIAVKRVRPMAADEWDALHTLREIRLMRILAFHPNVRSPCALTHAKPTM